MRRTLLIITLSLVFGSLSLNAQTTAGYSPERTGLASQAGALAPPFELADSLDLPDGFDAVSFAVRGDYVVVGEGGSPTRYVMINRSNGSVIWTKELAGAEGVLNYKPAFSTSTVLLGGAATTTVSAVEILTGDTLWEDSIVGAANGRHPYLTRDLALYHGSNSVAAVRPDTGVSFWRYPTTASTDVIETAEAPAATAGNRVYFVLADGSLAALSLLSGELAWTRDNVAGNGSNLIATSEGVFAARSTIAPTPALSSTTIRRISPSGVVDWSTELEGALSEQGLFLAYGTLYAISTRGGSGGSVVISAIDPISGNIQWEAVEPAPPPIGGVPAVVDPKYGLFADNHIFFYNAGTHQVRVLDAFTGTVRWSLLTESGVRGLAVDDGTLHVLYADRMESYVPSHEIYLAHLADGQGATTLYSLVNLGSETATGEIEFFADDGSPLPLAIEGVLNVAASLPFSIPPGRTVKIRTAGLSAAATPGWARVQSSQPITGTAIFQYTEQGVILFEAGVADAPLTGEARLFVARDLSNPSGFFETGVAVVNPLDETASVTATFRPLQGDAVVTASFNLGPGEHLARFLEEIFEGTLDDTAEGTLTLRSRTPIVVTALRTQDGLQMSSYPVGIPIH